MIRIDLDRLESDGEIVTTETPEHVHTAACDHLMVTSDITGADMCVSCGSGYASAPVCPNQCEYAYDEWKRSSAPVWTEPEVHPYGRIPSRTGHVRELPDQLTDETPDLVTADPYELGRNHEIRRCELERRAYDERIEMLENELDERDSTPVREWTTVDMAVVALGAVAVVLAVIVGLMAGSLIGRL